MGVLGLTPFLQNGLYSPEVVKQLPDRLRGFAGKKIVIDGTLITQRLHFSQVPHHYRHVVGWYKLVRELQDSGVSAICVFDGKERSAAKAREAERRREAQKLAIARGSIELDRVKRLHRLVDVLGRFQLLDVIEKGRVSELLKQISSKTVKDTLDPSLFDISPTPTVLEIVQQRSVPSSDDSGSEKEVTHSSVASSTVLPQPPKESKTTYNDNDPTLEPHPQPLASATPPSPKQKSASLSSKSDSEAETIPPSSQEAPDTLPLDEASAVTPQSSELDLSPLPILPSVSPASSASRLSTPSPTVSPLERPFPSAPIPEVPDEVPSSPVDSTLASLASLYFEFRDSVHKLASLTPPPPDTLQCTNTAEQQEARVEYSMTKSQIQLTADEAKLWKELAEPPSSDSPDHQPPEETLTELSYRAYVMSQSYERRNNPPTTQTYDESKELLRTMGVACIDTTGTYEAEALASSLVINGFADYVASEDTDVIIYEAPLIRGLTNRNVPLVMLSGPEIRTALELDRSSFIDFALLLGTDFSQRIKNVGPVRALKFIRQHKSIERVIEVEKKYTPRVPPPAYLAEVELARLVFQTLPPVPDSQLLEQNKDDEALSVVLQRFGLGKLLMDEEDWDFEDALRGNYFSDDPSV
ncbi:PIN domain-like protein [Mycena leptocephala]|nr:PIN domain-like protein [Mycena leptocephala]